MGSKPMNQMQQKIGKQFLQLNSTNPLVPTVNQ